MTHNPWAAVERAMVGDIYTSRRAMDDLEVLCDDLGPRFAGTPNERAAAELIATRYREYGLTEVALEPYEYAGWTRGTATLQVVEPVARELSCISLPYCQAGTWEARLVDVGMGTPTEFATATVEGAFAMASSASPPRFGRWIHRKEKYTRAQLGGAVGFIFAGEHLGAGPETGSLEDDRPAAIPGLSIAREHAAYLKRLVRRHGQVRLRLVTTDVNEPRTSWNVVGRLPGLTRPDEAVAIGCHYDGHDIAQGAVDPASGLVVLLEAARVLGAWAAEELGRSVQFLAWGTEEIGLIGSQRWAAAHRGELDALRFYLNADSAGAAFRKGLVLHEWPELEPWFRTHLAQMASEAAVGQHVTDSSDHFNLLVEGVPTGGIGDPTAAPTGRGFGHTQWDTVDKVELADLREASALAARLLLRLSAAPELPVRRRSEAAVAALLDTHPNLEGLRVERALAART